MCDMSIYMYIVKVFYKWNMTGTWIYMDVPHFLDSLTI